MARTIDEIKGEMAQAWMSNEAVASRYGFKAGESFGNRFGAGSVESLLFWVFAVCVWVLERLMDEHRREVEELAEKMRVHRPRWYREMVLGFMADMSLGDDGSYDVSGMSEEAVARAHVVKHAVAVESVDSGVLTIKVAGERDGVRGPLSGDHERQLRAYIGEIKDAGVRIGLVNMEGDGFECELDVWFDVMRSEEVVRRGVESAVRDYVENLPFNGVFTNMGLVDSVQGVGGVKVVELRGSCFVDGNGRKRGISGCVRPEAGYMRVVGVTLNMKEYGTV